MLIPRKYTLELHVQTFDTVFFIRKPDLNLVFLKFIHVDHKALNTIPCLKKRYFKIRVPEVCVYLTSAFVLIKRK